MKMCCNHKQLNTQLQEYTEVPEEAIWWHRMQEKPSADRAPPRTQGSPSGAQRDYRASLPPQLAGGEGDWLPLSNYPLLSALRVSPPVPLLKNCGPWCRPHLMQAGDAPESDIGYD